MRTPTVLTALALAAGAASGCAFDLPGRGAAPPPLASGVSIAEMESRLAALAPSRLDFDDAALEPWEREVLGLLVEASDVMGELFALQVSPRNPEWRAALARSDEPGAGSVLAYFDIMAGPWDRLDEHRPFLDVSAKPLGAGYYPEDLGEKELERWLADHPEDREAFTGYFSVIRRQHGNLVAIPYSRAYRPQLQRAAALLREAAGISRNESLSRYLRLRADAFLSDDYFESDMAWMELDSRIEPTIGPYEVYEDRLRGAKAAFESFITVADEAASAELEQLKHRMRFLEENLPIADRHRNLDRGFESPIRVVDVAYTAGDTRAGVQTIAFNLPNDERVREAKGSKKVMLRNVSRAKFEQIVTPIAREVLEPALLEYVTFQPWFTFVVMHELAHGLGPGFITTASGERTTVNQALREHYSALEEAKADVAGLHSLTVLAAEGLYDDAFVREALVGHLANMFRAVRFGATAAHGRSNMVQFNWLWERGAIGHDAASGRFSLDIDAAIEANRELATEILTLQAEGDYERAGRLLERYGDIRPEMRAALDRLGGVPVDIRPEYVVLEKMEGW